MSDQQITCSECGGVFVFTEAEQDFYASKGLAAPPKRCKSCRQARRAAREGGGGSGNFARAPQRRFSNDVNEYRSPMGGGDQQGFQGGRPPRRNDRNGPPPAFRGGGGGGGFRGGDRPRAPRFGGQGGGNANASTSGEYRSPSFPRARPERAEWGSHTAPQGGDRRPRARAEHGDRRIEGGAAPARAPKAKPERPKYDITCATCGAQAQVPFKPLEGRQVFCQACYRARKGTTTPEQVEVAAATESDADVGIVE